MSDSESTEERKMDLEQSIKEKSEDRSKKQGIVRQYLTKLHSFIVTSDSSNIAKVEEYQKKVLTSRKNFIAIHDELVDLLEVNGKNTSDVNEKLAAVDADVKSVYTSAQSWITEMKKRTGYVDTSEASLVSPQSEDLDVTIMAKGSLGAIEETAMRQNQIMSEKLAHERDENDVLQQRLSDLQEQMSDYQDTRNRLRALEISLQQSEADRRASDKRYSDTIGTLESELNDKDRQLQSAKRLSFYPGDTSSPRPARDSFVSSNTSLAADDLQRISMIVANSNADAFKNILSNSMLQQKQLCTSLNIPQVEIKKFEGDLTSYFAFTNRFDELVGNTDATYAVKLGTFLQFCNDTINAELDCCNHKPAEEGYRLARKMLQETYGDPYLVSQAWVDKLNDFGKVKSASDMLRYSSLLRSASETLSSLGFLSELECVKSMRVIIEKTPVHVQQKWRTAHREARESGRKATLAKMIQLISNAAKEMGDPIYGHESLLKLSHEDDVRMKKPSVSRKKSVATVLSMTDSDTEAAVETSLPPKEPCVICGDSQRTPHLTSRCFVYRDMAGEEKYDFAVKYKLCFLCLNSDHTVSDCPSPASWKCRMPDCSARHHFTLHRGITLAAARAEKKPKRECILFTEDEIERGDIEPISESYHAEADYVCRLSGRLHAHYVLPILPVLIMGKNGFMTTHVLQDTGSCVSLITKRVQEELDLEPVGTSTMNLKGMFAQRSFKAKVVDVSLKGKGANFIQEAADVVVMNELQFGAKHVQAMRKVSQYPHIQPLKIAPFANDHIDMLIGQDNAYLFEPLCKVSGKHKFAPYALRTRLGWTVHGNVTEKLAFWDAFEDVSLFDSLGEPPLEETLRSMWDLDKVPEAEPHSPINRQIIKMWEKKIELKDGHWELPIPFVNEPPNLPNNYAQAKRNLDSLGRRLNRDEKLKSQYIQSMVKNFTSGYAEIAPEIANPGYEWYNTHLPVIQETRPGKCRIVKNASLPFQKTSLNDSVHQGPNLTANIVDIDIRFRVYKVALTGDVKEMYNQVHVPEYQRDSLRFLWWKDDSW